jgi:hypothetical protein
VVADSRGSRPDRRGVTFEAHPPTRREGEDQVLVTDTVVIGQDDHPGGGSRAGLDASAAYTLDLAGIEPQPTQGVHVKLTIHAEGSRGADVKHKVFWVTGCVPAPTTTTVAPTTSTAPSTTAAPTTTVCPTTTTAPSTTVGPSSTVKPTTSTDKPTTSTAKPTTSTDKPKSAALAATAEPSTSHGATTTAPPTTIPTSTSGATTTTACPGDAALSGDLTSDAGPFDSPGLLPLAASGVALLSIAATSLLGLRRRRL